MLAGLADAELQHHTDTINEWVKSLSRVNNDGDHAKQNVKKTLGNNLLSHLGSRQRCWG